MTDRKSRIQNLVDRWIERALRAGRLSPQQAHDISIQLVRAEERLEELREEQRGAMTRLKRITTRLLSIESSMRRYERTRDRLGGILKMEAALIPGDNEEAS